jgi:hypothetical protein
MTGTVTARKKTGQWPLNLSGSRMARDLQQASESDPNFKNFPPIDDPRRVEVSQLGWPFIVKLGFTFREPSEARESFKVATHVSLELVHNILFLPARAPISTFQLYGGQKSSCSLSV